ncbi:hypothetical protein ABFX02_05G077701 [Erythranthe guttata]
MQERRQQMCQHSLGKWNAGAYPSPRPKREIVKMIPSKITFPTFAIKKPLWLEFQWIIPNRRISLDRSDVYKDHGVPRYGVPSHGGRLRWRPRNQERYCWM